VPSLTRTFQTRLNGDQPALAATADLLSTVARRVDAALARGVDARSIAKTMWRPSGISSKNLDHILRQVQAKRRAVTELAKVQAEDLRTRIHAKERQISRKRSLLAELPRQIRVLKAAGEDPQRAEEILASLPNSLHQHARRLSRLHDMLAAAKRRVERPSICHGSRDLFLRQFHLHQNGYADHAAWLAEWRAVRSSQFMVEGDAVYPSGSQFVRTTAREDGSFDLEVRLPPALHYIADRRWTSKKGDPLAAIDLKGVRFAHGDDEIRAALAEGRPLSWRFLRDETSWRAFVAVSREVGERIGSDWSNGVLGVDLNADHVALCHVSHDGNPLEAWRIPVATYGLSGAQRLDLVRKACAEIRAIAERLGLPVVSERLDFRRKKAQLTSDDGPRRARQLSSFAYAGFHMALRSALVRVGVRHVRVNPAYTSLIGRVKFARPHGLSAHAAASLSIGRRAMGLSERPPGTVHADREGVPLATLSVPLDGGGHVTLPAPVRMRIGPRGARRHVWSTWSRVAKDWKAAHEAHARSRRKTRSAAASGVHPPAAGVTGGLPPIGRGRRRPSREVVGATACPGAEGTAYGMPSERVSIVKSV
jgi:IS605 OrfB family transposase